MTEFHIEDTEGIINYIKSLDIYSQFDEIIAIPITENTQTSRTTVSIEIRIKSDDRLFFIYTDRRPFTSPTINLSDRFEREIKYLSASILFGRKLVECIDAFSRFNVVDSDRVNLVIAENKTSKYVLQVYLNDEEIAVAKVSAKFKFGHDSFRSYHEFKSESAVEIERLKDLLQSFEKLKSSISLD